MSRQDRRDFLRLLGLGAATFAGSGLLSRVSSAAPLDGGVTGRGLVDRALSSSSGLALVDGGDGCYHLVADGLPDHPTGRFPNERCPFPVLARSGSTANPMKISKSPKVAAAPTDLNGWLFGVAVNGVMFDPTGPYWKGDSRSGWQFEVLAFAKPYLGIDTNNAHSQESGEYHYHGMPQGLVNRLQAERLNRGETLRMLLIGWAADGFPVYAPWGHRDPRDPSSPLVELRSSYRQRSGARPGGSPGGHHDTSIFVQDFEYRPGSGELDECNGRFGATPEFPQGTYHYVVTNAFPFIPRKWRGTPDGSFFHPSPGLAAVPRELLNLDYTRL